MENPIGLLVTCLYGGWLLLTLAIHFIPSLSKSSIFNFLDRTYLIPRWNFFAPNPCTFDQALLYRWLNEDGNFTNCKEVALRQRRAWNFLLYPQKRIMKVHIDCLIEIMETHKTQGQGIKLTIPYITILSYVATESIKLDSRAQKVQFFIMTKHGGSDYSESEIVFMSAVHEI